VAQRIIREQAVPARMQDEWGVDEKPASCEVWKGHLLEMK